MKRGMLYIHGKGGSAAEAAHYASLFPEWDVAGLDYRAETPWDAQAEFTALYDAFAEEHARVRLIANSIGAWFALHALGERKPEKAYLISPIADMERLILDMLGWAQSTEEELERAGTLETDFGETLSWDYLVWVRKHPISWSVPTAILYGSRDRLQSRASVEAFARRVGASLTVMEDGEHWFHTEEQMRFLDRWITSA